MYVGFLTPYCEFDLNGNDACDDAEMSSVDYVVADPDYTHGIVVYDLAPPDQTVSFTGMLREDASDIASNLTAHNEKGETVDVRVSPQVLLDEGERPGSSVGAFLGAGLLGIFALVLLLGSRIGPVVFRREPAPWVSLGAEGRLEPGDSVATHVSGILDDVDGGRVRARDVTAQFRRDRQTSVDRPDASARPDAPSSPVIDSEDLRIVAGLGSTGLAVTRTDLQSVESGRVVTPRSIRPGLRIRTTRAGVTVSFDSAAVRDRMFAELMAEGRLQRGADQVARR
jgi:hypothetical protein